MDGSIPISPPEGDSITLPLYRLPQLIPYNLIEKCNLSLPLSHRPLATSNAKASKLVTSQT